VGREIPRRDGLLVVGTPNCEPWHFVAHLADEAAYAGRPDLSPTWVRWKVEPGAPAHLSVGIDRLGALRSDTIIVISPEAATESLLDRVEQARRQGSLVLAIDRGDPDVGGLAHERLAVPNDAPPASFDVAQHLVTELAPGARGRTQLTQSRLMRLLETTNRLLTAHR
jgi:hypothetical protein